MTKSNIDLIPDNFITRSISGIRSFIDRRFKYITVTPLLLLVIVLAVYPTFQLLRMSVSEVELIRSETNWTFVGLKHLQTLSNDLIFPVALKNTLIFVVVVVVIEMVLALFLAIMVSRTTRFVGFYRTVILFPLLIPPVAISAMWLLMYDFNIGLINQLLGVIGVEGKVFLANAKLAMPSVMVVDIWNWTSFLFLILYAGLESLPHDLSEAARIDGASERQIYQHVILPLLRPTIMTALVLRTIFAIKVFDEVYILTGGGPGIATTLISPYIFDVFFSEFRWGYGAFLSLIPLAITLIFVVIFQWVNRQTVD